MNEKINKALKLAISHLELIEKDSPFYIQGSEWDWAWENSIGQLWQGRLFVELNNLDNMNLLEEDNFYNIPHIAMSEDKARHVCHANHILSHCIKENSVICEIGAGNGGVCKNIISSRKDLTYIIFDIPHTLSISSLMLNLSLPKDFNTYYYSEENFDFEKVIKENNLILLPHFLLPRLPQKCLDLLISTGCLCEMPEKTFTSYVDIIKEKLKDQSKLYIECRAHDNLWIKEGGMMETNIWPYLNSSFTEIDTINPHCTRELAQYRLKMYLNKLNEN